MLSTDLEIEKPMAIAPIEADRVMVIVAAIALTPELSIAVSERSTTSSESAGAVCCSPEVAPYTDMETVITIIIVIKKQNATLLIMLLIVKTSLRLLPVILLFM